MVRFSMDCATKKKIKEMTRNEFCQYKKEKQKERRDNISEEKKNIIKLKDKLAKKVKSSCLTVTEKDKFNERERERKMQSRNLKTNAEEEYSKILDRQSKRRKGKDKFGGGSVEVGDKEEITEWLDFFQKGEDHRKVLEKLNVDCYKRCEVIVDDHLGHFEKDERI